MKPILVTNVYNSDVTYNWTEIEKILQSLAVPHLHMRGMIYLDDIMAILNKVYSARVHDIEDDIKNRSAIQPGDTICFTQGAIEEFPDYPAARKSKEYAKLKVWFQKVINEGKEFTVSNINVDENKTVRYKIYIDGGTREDGMWNFANKEIKLIRRGIPVTECVWCGEKLINRRCPNRC